MTSVAMYQFFTFGLTHIFVSSKALGNKCFQFPFSVQYFGLVSLLVDWFIFASILWKLLNLG